MAKIQPQTTGAGSQSLPIGWEDFIKGASTSNTLPDAGFSPSSYNVNLISNKGRVTPTALPTADALTSNIVATSTFIDNNTFKSWTAAIDTNKRFWYATTSTSAGWLGGGQDAASRTYASPDSDIVGFYSSGTALAFASSKTNIAYWNGSNPNTVTSDWFSTNFAHSLQSGYVHPMIIFNGYLYIADGRYLHKYDGASEYTYKQLTLEDYTVITALSIDPNTGKMMVAYSTDIIYNGSYTGTDANAVSVSKIGLYDGTNPTQFIKLTIVDATIKCMFANGGQVYIGYGTHLGLWNGSGITFLRQLDNQLYKNQITNIGNDVYYADGNDIWCYTELVGGQKKVFNKVYSAGYPITFIASTDSKSKLAFGVNNSGSYTNYFLNMNNAGDYTQTALFQSNIYSFPRPIYIRAIDIITESTLGANDTIVASFLDDLGSELNFTPTTAISGVVPRSNRLQGGSDKTLSFQLKLTMNTSVPFRRAVVYYDFAE